jgi:hypothetical protein
LSSGSFEGSTMAGRGKYPAVDPLPARLRGGAAVLVVIGCVVQVLVERDG